MPTLDKGCHKGELGILIEVKTNLEKIKLLEVDGGLTSKLYHEEL